MLCVGANAVAHLRELAIAPKELRGVVSGAEDGGLDAFTVSIKAVFIPTISDPATIVAVTLQTPYAASQFGYGRGVAAGRRFQSRGRGGRGRGAFGSNFILLGGQLVSVEVSEQSASSEEMNDSGELDAARNGKAKRAGQYQRSRGEQSILVGTRNRQSNWISQQRRIGIRNKQRDELIGDLIVEQNICNKETRRRIEENNGLSTVEYIAKIPAFYNERSEQGIGNMEIKRLSMLDGHQISVQSCSSNGRIGEIPSIYTQGNPLYVNRNAIRDLDSTEDLRKDNINSNGQSEKQELSSYSKLCRRHSISDEGSGITREGNGVDIRGVQEIWMGDQREEEKAEAGVTVCIPGMDVQLNNNEDLIDQRENEGIECASSKIDKANNGGKSIKYQKRGKFGWQAK
ncbi:MAG: hypothetical protein EZS28_042082, partial [Streblomastix strix]